jgi:hypothetical protein
MVYDIQKHWVSGFVHRPETARKYKVSETGSVTVFRSEEGDTYSAGSFKKS